WGAVGTRAYEVEIVVRGYDRRNMQRDVTDVVSNSDARIVASSSRVFADSGEVEVRFTLRVHDFGQLSVLLDKLSALPNVIDARRIGTG
ncbi:MAG: bifunctional (p)ppGpp synthetase/guanosine-3',5'-bis(diphosphate) 3'-pyrophosphohydrolase, partial [Xanthomonadales bacterium]|nr:bifunctional (p)ppGpp synthetase/guanosine-3',5'-bis(diphosphate) 3'-pyrophosphohydrolase [Xanthomonadales bacterium]